MFLTTLCITLYPLFLLTAAQTQDEPCTLRDGNKLYDLRTLQGSTDYKFTTPGKQNFTLNICKAVTDEGWNLKDVNRDQVGGFVRQSRGDFCIGKSNTTLSLAPETDPPVVLLTMTEGSVCGESDTPRAASVIRFVCSDTTEKQPRMIAQLPPSDDEACAWVFEWKTPAACANSSGGSFFYTLFSTIIILAALYLILGTLYNRYVLNLSGMAQIPRFSLESAKYHGTEFLFLVMDWWEKLRGQSNHGGLPRTNPVSHQSSQFAPQEQPQEASAEVNNGDGFGFVRPSRKPSGKASNLNPVSHQSTVLAARTRAQEAGTREEREFMLGDDDDDDYSDEPTPRTDPPQPPSPRTVTGPSVIQSAQETSVAPPPPPRTASGPPLVAHTAPAAPTPPETEPAPPSVPEP